MTRLIHAFLAALLLLAISCVPALSADAPVAISVHAAIKDGLLRIHGSATVPDGAWIIFAAYRVADPQRRITGYAKIKDEQFTARTDVSNWPAGAIAVDANFQMRMRKHEQPAAVIARFGRNGEYMRGEEVVQGGGAFRAAIASTRVIKHR